jgi:hypothetical protein
MGVLIRLYLLTVNTFSPWKGLLIVCYSPLYLEGEFGVSVWIGVGVVYMAFLPALRWLFSYLFA